MNLNISQQQFDDMESKIFDISRLYLNSIKQIRKAYPDLNGEFVDDNSSDARYIKKVNKTYSKLCDKSKLIINNDFFYQESFPDWWKKYYSPKTYFEGKKRAMISFLAGFEDA